MRCNFCNCHKDALGDRGGLLIASELTGVFICDGCLVLALGTLVQHRPAQRRKLLRVVQGAAAKSVRGAKPSGRKT